MSTSWKDLERRVAHALGGTRNHVGEPGSDVIGCPFSVEVKRTQRYSLRRDWVEQARRQSRADGKPWVLVVAEHRDRNPIVVMDFKAWVERG